MSTASGTFTCERRVTGRMAKLTRTCPRDRSTLEERKVAVFGPDVALDACPACAGVFLDKNELRRLTGDAELNAYLRDHHAGKPDSDLVCPACGSLMGAEDVEGVEVDVCLSCFGIWLDKGELEGLKAREGAGEAVPLSDEKRSELTDAEHATWRRHSPAGPFAKLTRGLSEFARRYL